MSSQVCVHSTEVQFTAPQAVWPLRHLPGWKCPQHTLSSDLCPLCGAWQFGAESLSRLVTSHHHPGHPLFTHPSHAPARAGTAHLGAAAPALLRPLAAILSNDHGHLDRPAPGVACAWAPSSRISSSSPSKRNEVSTEGRVPLSKSPGALTHLSLLHHTTPFTLPPPPLEPTGQHVLSSSPQPPSSLDSPRSLESSGAGSQACQVAGCGVTPGRRGRDGELELSSPIHQWKEEGIILIVLLRGQPAPPRYGD